MSGTKVCSRCKQPRLLSEFSKNKAAKDGLQGWCSSCLHTQYNKTRANGSQLYSSIACRIRARSKRKGMQFDLTREDIKDWWVSTPDSCHYCGISVQDYLKIQDYIISYTGDSFEINRFKRFFWGKHVGSINRLTIDRRDNSKGYTVSNMVKACWICNSIKTDFFSEEQMKAIAHQITTKLVNDISIAG